MLAHLENQTSASVQLGVFEPGSVERFVIQPGALNVKTDCRCVLRLNNENSAFPQFNSRPAEYRASNVIPGLAGIGIEADRIPDVPG